RFCLCLLPIRSRPQPAQELNLICARQVNPGLAWNYLFLHGERRPEIGNLRWNARTDEIWRRDPHDSERRIVHFDDFSEDLTLRTELALPEWMTEHHHGMPP